MNKNHYYNPGTSPTAQTRGIFDAMAYRQGKQKLRSKKETARTPIPEIIEIGNRRLRRRALGTALAAIVAIGAVNSGLEKNDHNSARAGEQQSVLDKNIHSTVVDSAGLTTGMDTEAQMSLPERAAKYSMHPQAPQQSQSPAPQRPTTH